MADRTHLEVVNNILVRLRETPVTSIVDTAYSKLVGLMVAEAYEEVLDDWNWSGLHKEAYIVYPADATQLIASGSNTFPVPLTAAEFLERRYGTTYLYWADLSPSDMNFLEEGYDRTTPVHELPESELQQLRVKQLIKTVDYPTHISITKNGLNDELRLETLQKASAERTLVLQYYERPIPLNITGDSDEIPLSIPYRPVQELAMMYLLNERGEEMGEPGNVAETRYLRALAAAKEKDLKSIEGSDLADWRRM